MLLCLDSALEKGNSIRRRAFSLLELVVVIVVMSVIAAIAVPRMSSAADHSRFANTYSTFNAIERAAEYYKADHQFLPPDFYTNTPHLGFKSYMDTSIFLKPTPLGGDWDWNNRYNASGNVVSNWTVIGPNISIVLTNPPITKWIAFDRYADDGNVSSGRFTRFNSRFLISKVPE